MTLRQEDKALFKVTVLDALPSMYIFLIAIIIAAVFAPPVPWFIFIMITIVLTIDVTMVLRGKVPRSPKRVFIMTGTMLAFLYVVSLVQFFAGWLGVLSFLAVPVAIAIYYLVRRWGLYMSWVRHIEKRFFGMTAEERAAARRREKV